METYVIDCLRSPIGKYGGSLSSVRPDDLAALIIKALMARNNSFDPKEIEEVILGAANQSGEDNRNVARMAVLLAGLPVEVAGVTVNRLCASGLQAIADATRCIKAGDGEFYIAGGVESMSRAPMVLSKATAAFERTQQIFDTTIGWRFINPALSKLFHPFSMGETAENVASKWNISRLDQDEFAYNSQLKYQKAHENNKFAEEIAGVEIKNSKGEKELFLKDEHPRLTSVEKLQQLKPAFKEGGSVTAGNSSGINDGAAMMLLASEEAVKKYNLKPMARVISSAVAGVDPSYMGVGPVPAVQKLLKKNNLSIQDISLFELNEAFASQSLACIRDLHINPEVVNVNGGAIALGHPLGCSGTRISTTLLYELKRRNQKYGIATMCVGVGQGSAILYENII